MLIKFFKLIFLLILLLIIGSIFLPSTYTVERNIVINSSSDKIFERINNLKNWPTWTAWTKERFPDMEIIFQGPESGVGAVYHWQGNSTGIGSLQIIKAKPEQGIWYDLKFGKENKISHGSIILEKLEQGQGVKVTWQDSGDFGKNPFNKYFGLAMDKMIGPDFEIGLNNLKKQLES